jgi:hypothetical protein
MTFSAVEQKAIKWYMEQNDCIVTLSHKPNMFFQKKGTSELIQVNLNHILNNYLSDKKEVDRENKRIKDLAKREAERKSPFKETY